MKNPMIDRTSHALTEESNNDMKIIHINPKSSVARIYVVIPNHAGVFKISLAIIPAIHQQPIKGRPAISNAEMRTPDMKYHSAKKTKKLNSLHRAVIIENGIKDSSNFINLLFLVVIIMVSFP